MSYGLHLAGSVFSNTGGIAAHPHKLCASFMHEGLHAMQRVCCCRRRRCVLGSSWTMNVLCGTERRQPMQQILMTASWVHAVRHPATHSLSAFDSCRKRRRTSGSTCRAKTGVRAVHLTQIALLPLPLFCVAGGGGAYQEAVG